MQEQYGQKLPPELRVQFDAHLGDRVSSGLGQASRFERQKQNTKWLQIKIPIYVVNYFVDRYPLVPIPFIAHWLLTTAPTDKRVFAMEVFRLLHLKFTREMRVHEAEYMYNLVKSHGIEVHVKYY